jgi:hypothetical protein
MTKEIIDDFIKIHYEDLLVRCLNLCKGNKEHAYNLLGFLCEYLYHNIHKLSKLKGEPINKVLLAFTTRWLSNQIKWCRSDFHLMNNPKNTITSDNIYTGEYSDEIILNESELFDENYKEEFISLSDDYSDIQRDKIIVTKRFYSTLTPHLKSLFDLYFNEQLSLTKISKIIGIPATSLFLMIKQLKVDARLFYIKNKKIK